MFFLLKLMMPICDVLHAKRMFCIWQDNSWGVTSYVTFFLLYSPPSFCLLVLYLSWQRRNGESWWFLVVWEPLSHVRVKSTSCWNFGKDLFRFALKKRKALKRGRCHNNNYIGSDRLFLLFVLDSGTLSSYWRKISARCPSLLSAAPPSPMGEGRRSSWRLFAFSFLHVGDIMCFFSVGLTVASPARHRRQRTKQWQTHGPVEMVHPRCHSN